MVKSTFKTIYDNYLENKIELPLINDSNNLRELGDTLKNNDSSFYDEIASEHFVYKLSQSQNGVKFYSGRTTSRDKSLKGFYYRDENGSFTLYNSVKLSNPREFFTNGDLAHQLESREKYLSRRIVIEINNHILLEVQELVLVGPNNEKKIVGKRIIHYDFYPFANNVQSFISNLMYNDTFGGMEAIYDLNGNIKDVEIIGEYKIDRFDQDKVNKTVIIENFQSVEDGLIDNAGNRIYKTVPSLKKK